MLTSHFTSSSSLIIISFASTRCLRSRDLTPDKGVIRRARIPTH
jgi:hypothetical protein